jgi:hypothetical protein
MHGKQLVVLIPGQELRVMIVELDSNQFGQATGDDKKDQRRNRVLNPDDLMIDREVVFADKPLRFGMNMLR